MSFLGGGHNPAWGRDAGPPPPTNRQAFGGYSFGFPHQYGGLPSFSAAGFFAPQPQPQPQPQPPPYYPGCGAGGLGRGYAAAGAHVRPPQAAGQPVVDASLPAANMTNSTGGVGCEPGYNYFFPSEHTKIHIFETGDTPPWNLPPNYTSPFRAVHVPVNTTLGDLLRGFGATNPVPKKNKVFEVHQGGSGKWYKGLSYSGDDDKSMDMAIKDVGWDHTRTGLPGGKPVVYLYVTNG